MNMNEVHNKIHKVIKSCQTMDQLKFSQKYIELLIEKEVSDKTYKEIVKDSYKRYIDIPDDL